MAPFTQAAFIPDQFGYFTNGDEEITLQSGNVKFMENAVTKVKLNIKFKKPFDSYIRRFFIDTVLL